MKQEAHISLNIAYKDELTYGDIYSRVHLFLKQCALPVSLISTSKNNIAKELRLIWSYELHENLMAWNFGHTFQEILFIQKYKPYLRFVQDASVSMYITEDIPDFCRFGAPFLRQGVYLEKMDGQQWLSYIKNIDISETEHSLQHTIGHYQSKMIPKLIRARLSTAEHIIHTNPSKAAMPTLFSLYDAISALYIALDFHIPPALRRQFVLLEDYLFSHVQ